MEHATEAAEQAANDDKGHRKYYVEIEGVEFDWAKSTITVPELRALGGLPTDLAVIEIDPENNERTLAEDEVITLKPGHRYGKKVRFKRG